MGSIMSIPTALSVVLITGGILYGFLEKRPPPPAWNAPSFVTGTDSSAAEKESGKEKDRKKGKKKKGAKAEGGGAASKEQTTSTTNVVSFPAVVPGAFESAPLTPPEPATTTTSKPKSKKKKTKKSTSTRPAVDGDQQSESSATAPESSVSRPRKSTSGDAEGAWTRVETKKRVNTSASANGNGKGNGSGNGKGSGEAGVTTATSSVAEDSPEEKKEKKENGSRRTLAEKLLPKARKTGVEDMLQTPDTPPLSRVLRVTPRADERPAAGFSWGDYEDVEPSSSQASLSRADGTDGEREGKDVEESERDGEREVVKDGQKEEEDDGWVTKSSRRPARPKPTPTTSELAQSSPDALTKKQRQNAAKRASQKSAKALAEAERLSALSKHKRELEQLRIKEGSGGSGRRREGAGMSSFVNGKGQLVWD